jgi:acyl dehydratase
MNAFVVTGLDELTALLGQPLGRSDELLITPEMVDEFASATGDEQWIHVDVERAKATRPFGGPIAHGYLTLVAYPCPVAPDHRRGGLQDGRQLRSGEALPPSPVPIGARVHTAAVDAVDEIAGGVQMALNVTMSVVGAPKPACFATVLLRRYT